MSPKDTKYAQSVAGTLLYDGMYLNNTMLPVLHEIASVQSNPMATTTCEYQHLLNHANIYPNAYISYHTMVWFSM